MTSAGTTWFVYLGVSGMFPAQVVADDSDVGRNVGEFADVITHRPAWLAAT